jgi:hypothetical protein
MSDDLELFPEFIALQQRRRKRMIIIASIILALIAGGVAARPVYRWVKAWRARQLAAQAEVAIKAGNLEEALSKARAAYQLSVDEPASLRAVAQVDSAAGHTAESVVFWQRLASINSLTPADRRAEADDYLRSGDITSAEAQNDSLLYDFPNDPNVLLQAARIAGARANYRLALQYARDAAQQDPKNMDAKLLVALVEVRTSDPATHQAGLAAAMELSTDQGSTGLRALDFLVTQLDLTAGESMAVIDRLRKHPLASEEERLSALEAEVRVRSADRDSILEKAFNEYSTASVEKKHAFALWLNAHSLYERTLELIPLSDALMRRDTLLVYLDALASLRRWSDIEDILGGKNVPLDEFYSEVFLARSAMELGQATIASLHWTRAHQAAEPSVDEMWYLGNYAEKIGQTDQAQRAYNSLKDNATTARPAYESLLRLAKKKGDDGEIRRLLIEMQQRWPHDDAVANDAVYFNLLKDIDLQLDLQIAQGLVQRAPDSMAHRTTLALAYYRLGAPGLALDVYSGLRIPWDQVPANNRAVYAAVLGLAGKQEQARTEAAALHVEDLRPEEKALVKAWLPQLPQ